MDFGNVSVVAIVAIDVGLVMVLASPPTAIINRATVTVTTIAVAVGVGILAVAVFVTLLLVLLLLLLLPLVQSF